MSNNVWNNKAWSNEAWDESVHGPVESIEEPGMTRVVLSLIHI